MMNEYFCLHAVMARSTASIYRGIWEEAPQKNLGSKIHLREKNSNEYVKHDYQIRATTVVRAFPAVCFN